jgi:acyl-coenzyme A thioesterase PaaI-like protein
VAWAYLPAAMIVRVVAAVAQGGLVCACLDNAMTMALRAASNDRFQTTLSLTTEYLAAVRPGFCWVEARATMVGGTVGFAAATLYRDQAMTVPLVRATSTNKLRKPTLPRAPTSPTPRL